MGNVWHPSITAAWWVGLLNERVVACTNSSVLNMNSVQPTSGSVHFHAHWVFGSEKMANCDFHFFCRITFFLILKHNYRTTIIASWLKFPEGEGCTMFPDILILENRFRNMLRHFLKLLQTFQYRNCTFVWL